MAKVVTAQDRAQYSAEFLRDCNGWEGRQFYGSRIDQLEGEASPLSADNRARFAAMPYPRQCIIVGKLIEKGSMI